MPRPLIQSTPSITDLKEWVNSKEKVGFINKQNHLREGLLLSYKPIDENDYLITLMDEDYKAILIPEWRLSEIISYRPQKIPSIFVGEHDCIAEKIGLQSEGKTLWVNQTLLSERLHFFRNMFRSGMKESNQKIIDVSPLFKFEEIELLLLAIDQWDDEFFENLSLPQTRLLLKLSDIICDAELENKARIKFEECVTKPFFEAVRNRNYRKIYDLLQEKADINKQFGKFTRYNAVTGFEPYSASDTPLIFAIRMGYLVLTQFLLENNADPNFSCEQFAPPNPEDQSITTGISIVAAQSNYGILKFLQKSADTNIQPLPLTEALLKGDPRFVELLLKNGANPNLIDEFTGMDLMETYLHILKGAHTVELLLENRANPYLIDEFTGFGSNLTSTYFHVLKGTNKLEADFNMLKLLLVHGYSKSFEEVMQRIQFLPNKVTNDIRDLFTKHQKTLSKPHGNSPVSLALSTHTLFPNSSKEKTSSTDTYCGFKPGFLIGKPI